jgi:hypothetical protein
MRLSPDVSRESISAPPQAPQGRLRSVLTHGVGAFRLLRCQMSGVHISEWRLWTHKKRMEFSCAMTSEELRDTHIRAKVFHCAALGYVKEPKKGRIPIKSSVRFEIAARHGCSAPGSRVEFECRCGSRHNIVWVAPFHPKIKNSKGWIYFVGLHIDHIRPVSLGGSNDPSNLQLLCARCNLSKYNRWVG